MEQENKIIVFQDKEIRCRGWHNEEWWFSVVDVVEVLADSADPRQYITVTLSLIATGVKFVPPFT